MYLGVTLQTLDPHKFDKGMILAQTKAPGISIHELLQDTVRDAHDVQPVIDLLADVGASQLLTGLEQGVHVPPLVEKTSYAPRRGPLVYADKITTEDFEVDWERWTIRDFERRVRVLGSAFTHIVKVAKRKMLLEDPEPVFNVADLDPPEALDPRKAMKQNKQAFMHVRREAKKAAWAASQAAKGLDSDGRKLKNEEEEFQQPRRLILHKVKYRHLDHLSQLDDPELCVRGNVIFSNAEGTGYHTYQVAIQRSDNHVFLRTKAGMGSNAHAWIRIMEAQLAGGARRPAGVVFRPFMREIDVLEEQVMYMQQRKYQEVAEKTRKEAEQRRREADRNRPETEQLGRGYEEQRAEMKKQQLFLKDFYRMRTMAWNAQKRASQTPQAFSDLQILRLSLFSRTYDMEDLLKQPQPWAERAYPGMKDSLDRAITHLKTELGVLRTLATEGRIPDDPALWNKKRGASQWTERALQLGEEVKGVRRRLWETKHEEERRDAARFLADLPQGKQDGRLEDRPAAAVFEREFSIDEDTADTLSSLFDDGKSSGGTPSASRTSADSRPISPAAEGMLAKEAAVSPTPADAPSTTATPEDSPAASLPPGDSTPVSLPSQDSPPTSSTASDSTALPPRSTSGDSSPPASPASDEPPPRPLSSGNSSAPADKAEQAKKEGTQKWWWPF